MQQAVDPATGDLIFTQEEAEKAPPALTAKQAKAEAKAKAAKEKEEQAKAAAASKNAVNPTLVGATSDAPAPSGEASEAPETTEKGGSDGQLSQGTESQESSGAQETQSGKEG